MAKRGRKGGDDAREERAKELTERAIERAVGEGASPELREAATEAIAPWAERLVRALDDLIRIPGTRWGFGLDPLIGLLLPGAGDAITGLGSISLLLLAFKERVPTVVILRMIMNILVDTIGGMLPFAGDAFDFLWRSNKRNLALIEAYREDPKAEPTWKDYALVGLGIFLAIVSIVLPIVLVWVIGLGAILGLLGLAAGD